jgi:hypothetical protein
MNETTTTLALTFLKRYDSFIDYLSQPSAVPKHKTYHP